MDTVSRRTALSYGGVALPLSLFAVTFYVFLPKFYSDVTGADLALLGMILLGTRIFDAVLDPVMGRLSDRLQFRGGRRLPWMAIGMLPLCLSAVALSQPSIVSTDAAALWFAGWSVLFFLFWTIVAVPYEALGAELSFDYHERTRVLGLRDGAFVLGTLFAAVGPFVYTVLRPAVGAEERLFHLMVCYSLLFLFAALLCFRNVKERRWPQEQLPTGGLFAGYQAVLQNRPFMVLLTAYTIGAFGAALPATLLLFYVEAVLNAPETAAQLCLVLYFLVGFLCLPLWIRLAERFGKKQTWLGAMLVNTVSFAGVFFLASGEVTRFAVCVALSAVGYGGTLVLPSSMQADVIDVDELHTGTRNEGRYVGLWSIAKKLSAALGAALALKLLSDAGYQTGSVQPPEALWMLRLLYAGVPCACNLLAVGIAIFYPIDKNRYEELRRELALRRPGGEMPGSAGSVGVHDRAQEPPV